MTSTHQIVIERETIRARIERKKRMRQSTSDDYAKLRQLTTKELKASIREERRRAA